MIPALERQVIEEWLLERRVTRFLHDEADLLSARRYREWEALLADDLCYRLPVRETLVPGQGSEHSEDMFHFDENRRTMRMRIDRFEGTAAWAENPPSRCRYFVSNIRAERRPDGLVGVRSELLFTRLRRSLTEYEMLTGERHDALRERGDSFELVERTVLLDNTTLPTRNLAFFL
ncbi:MAG: aromatic-ring-hydroxylating dioxygenase subunit beta [Acidimicrobiales bacterium]